MKIVNCRFSVFSIFEDVVNMSSLLERADLSFGQFGENFTVEGMLERIR
jgi:MOSC domain-containing protein YiiM